MFGKSVCVVLFLCILGLGDIGDTPYHIPLGKVWFGNEAWKTRLQQTVISDGN